MSRPIPIKRKQFTVPVKDMNMFLSSRKTGWIDSFVVLANERLAFAGALDELRGPGAVDVYDSVVDLECNMFNLAHCASTNLTLLAVWLASSMLTLIAMIVLTMVMKAKPSVTGIFVNRTITQICRTIIGRFQEYRCNHPSRPNPL
jgi:hypothetical protein